MSGILACLMEELNRLVRKEMPAGPRCLRCRLDIWSGPEALEAFAFFIASSVLVLEKVGASLRLFFFRLFVIRLLSLEVVCRTTDEY